VTGMEATTTGHYHVLLDGALINMFCTPDAVVSLQNVKPGMHTLTAVPALDDHAEVTANARSVMFDYAPATPLPTLVGVTAAGQPSIMILSPGPGATVSVPAILSSRSRIAQSRFSKSTMTTRLRLGIFMPRKSVPLTIPRASCWVNRVLPALRAVSVLEYIE